MSTRNFERFLERAITVLDLAHQVRALLSMGDPAAEIVARLATHEGFPCEAEEVLQVIARYRAVRAGAELTDDELDDISGGHMTFVRPGRATLVRGFEDPLTAFEDPLTAFEDPLTAIPRP
jgi:predicted ribosomally synthesized peptide with nif11-like leader